MTDTKTALITGASAGFGAALTRALAARGWQLIITARQPAPLHAVAEETGAQAVPGDVADPAHRARLAELVTAGGGLDLLVNNASRLGPSPMPELDAFPLDELAAIYQTNVIAPLGMLQLLRPALRAADGVAIALSSDAAREAYAGWGGYGSSKAALDHLMSIYAAEHPDLPCYTFDPGDMRTAMHQAAFPGEDITDRPEPQTVVPALLRLLDTRPASGRYLAADLKATA